MNKLFSLLLLLCLNFGQLQAQDNYYQTLDNIFQHIDLNRVPTGMLENYGYSFLELGNFKGQTLHDSNLVAMPQFWYALGAMEAGKVNSQYSLPTQASIQANFEQVSADGKIQIALAHYHYAQIRADAPSLGLLWASGGKLYENTNASQSPYEVKDLLAFAPTEALFNTGGINFILRSSL